MSDSHHTNVFTNARLAAQRPTAGAALRKVLTIMIAATALVSGAAQAGVYLLENFSGARPSVNGPARVYTDAENARFGLGCLAVEYDLASQNRADLWFDVRGRAAAIGTVSVWVKGDGSSNLMRFHLPQSIIDHNGNIHNRRNGSVIDVRLDFTDWRRFTAETQAPSEENAFLRLNRIEIMRDGHSKENSGKVYIDELTVDLPRVHIPGDVHLTMPSRLQDASDSVSLSLDIRNHNRQETATCTLQARVTDANGNRVAEMREQWQAPAASSVERVFTFDASLDGFVPPFEVQCNFISAALNTEISSTRKIAMPTAEEVYCDYSAVADLWRSGEARIDDYLERFQQPVMRLDKSNTLTRHTSEQDFGPFEMEWNYTLNDGRSDIFYSQFISGAPINMSFWIKGDGSGNVIVAGIRDWGVRVRGGGNNSKYSTREVCKLDFTGWRRFTIELPGGGLARYDSVGDRNNTIYPLELVGLSLRSGGEEAPATGSIRFGSITIENQGRASEALGITVADKYDDGLYHEGPGAATVTIYNYHKLHSRRTRMIWMIRDSDGNEFGRGAQDVSLDPASHKSIVVELPSPPTGGGPFLLVANLRDLEDPSATASVEKVLAKPNSVVKYSFERLRDYHSSFNPLFRSTHEHFIAPVPSKVQGPEIEPNSGRPTVPLVWKRNEDHKVSLSPLLIDPALPGHAVRIHVDVYGDGSGVEFYPMFVGRGSEPKDTYLDRFLTMTESVKIDFNGWRRLTFRAPIIQNNWNQDEFSRHRPLYPHNLMLLVAADDGAKTTSGKLFIGAIDVETHLPANDRLKLELALPTDADFLEVGNSVEILIANNDLTAPRTVQVEAQVQAPDGPSIARLNESITIPSGERRKITVQENMPRGAYWIIIKGTCDRRQTTSLHRPLVVMNPGDLAPDANWPDTFNVHMTEHWPERLFATAQLEKPVGEYMEYIQRDWDLIEPYPEFFANVPLGHNVLGLRQRLQRVRNEGRITRMMVGFAAHWAAGEGLEQRRQGAYSRPHRHVGYTTDFWHVPANIEDWDNYIYRLTREVGELVDVWSFWDNPDVPGLIQLDPKRAVEMLKSVKKWTSHYAPDSKIMLSGLNVGTAVNYLQDVLNAGGGDLFDIINIKINPGVHPPEIWRFREYILGIQAVAPGKEILVTEMDWPIEPDTGDGTAFNGLGQAENQARTCLLAHWMGIAQPQFRLTNQDDYATGTGLMYRLDSGVSGANLKSPHMVPRPAYLALLNVRQMLDELTPYSALEMDDLHVGNTHLFIYTAKQGSVAAVWRVEGSGSLTLPETLNVAGIMNIYGTPVALGDQRQLAVSQTPIFINLPQHSPTESYLAFGAAKFEPEESEVYEKVMVLRDRVMPLQGESHNYTAEGDTQPVSRRALLPGYGMIEVNGLTGITSESFEVECPADQNMVLRRRYLLEDGGSVAEVIVNGKSAGRWNLAHDREGLAGGLRDAFYIVPKNLLNAAGRQKVELRYGENTAITCSFWALSIKSDAVPLVQLAPIYAAQAVGELRIDRNVVGDPMRIGTQAYERGLGTHAWSLIEYPLNGQFKELTVTVGVDAASDGRGTVVFEVIGDNETLSLVEPVDDIRVAKTPILTGLTRPFEMTVDVRGVDRLTLVVHDGGDGNRADAANWLNPILKLK